MYNYFSNKTKKYTHFSTW